MGSLYKRNGTRIIIDFRDTVVVPAEEIERFEKDGYHALEIIDSAGGKMFRRTKKPDGLTRSTEKTWALDTKLNVYETDFPKWQELVTWWFDNFRNDTDTIKRVSGKFSPETMSSFIDSAERFMRDQRPRRDKRGKRESDLYNWMFNSRRSYFAFWIRNK